MKKLGETGRCFGWALCHKVLVAVLWLYSRWLWVISHPCVYATSRWERLEDIWGMAVRVKMKLANLVETTTIRSIHAHAETPNQLYKYWEEAKDRGNYPECYRGGSQRKRHSLDLVEVMQKYVGPQARILEIGCSVGRNLEYLRRVGFRNLEGIEINQKALQLMWEFYPELRGCCKVYQISVEEKIAGLEKCEYDVVFAVATLAHLHPDSEWVFTKMVRITRGYVITIENEYDRKWGRFPRNYAKIFEKQGMEQIEEAESAEKTLRVFSSSEGKSDVWKRHRLLVKLYKEGEVRENGQKNTVENPKDEVYPPLFHSLATPNAGSPSSMPG